MEKTVEELLRSRYWVIDILPRQVPADSPGQYFAVEDYFLSPPRLAEIKRRHTALVLKLACYYRVTVAGEGGAVPAPELLAGRMLGGSLPLMVGGALLLSEPDDTYMTLYDPDAALLELVKALAAAEGLFVWQPPE